MAKVLGLDLGTNSLGWALVDESENEYTLIDKGVDIFQEGVARDKNNEKPAVQDRTSARGTAPPLFPAASAKNRTAQNTHPLRPLPAVARGAVDRLAKRETLPAGQ